MSKKPRRITELVQEVGSGTKPTRISRLPTRLEQTRRTSGTTRNSSDPTTLPVKNLLPVTNSRPKRSISATPQRTPLRFKTPTRQNQVSLTSERTNDKNWIVSESIKINDYIKEIEPPILGKDFFEKGGIKNMSTKQFLIIVNYFLKLIGGNRLYVGSNYVESMSKILNEIGYPYTVTKSWLKTPSAPHAFHNVILLFTWFLTFVPSNPLSKIIDQIEEYENTYVSENKEFPDKNYALNFVRQSREIFSVWNNGSDSIVEETKTKLANDMVQKNCDVECFNDLDSKIKSLKIEDEEIQSNLKEDSKVGEFNQLDMEYKLKIKEVENLANVCKVNSGEIKEITSKILLKENLIKSIESELEHIKLTIKKQRMPIKERDSLLMKVNALNHELKVKIENIKQLQEEGSENQISLSRLMYKKTTLITQLNTYIYKLFTEIKLSNLPQFEEFKLNKDCTMEDIKQVEVNLKKIFQSLGLKAAEIENDMKKLEQHTLLLTIEYEKILKPTLEKYIQQNGELNIEIEKADKNVFVYLNESENYINMLKNQFNEAISSKKHLLNKLTETSEKLKKLQESNIQNWNSFENEIDSLLTSREQKLNAIDEVINDFYKTMENLQKSPESKK